MPFLGQLSSVASGSGIDEVSDRERSENLARIFGEVDREDRRDGKVGLGLAPRVFVLCFPFYPLSVRS